MAFKSRSTALTVYQVASTETVVHPALLAGAFRSIDKTADEIGLGFVPFDNPLAAVMDQAMADAVHERGHYTVIGFRIDTRRIPGAVLKRHFKEAMDKEMAVAGKKFVSKDRKREIKDRVKLQLLARAEPVPAVVDVALDRMSGRLFFGSVSERQRGLFESYWFDRFGEKPLREDPYTLSGGMIEPGGVDFLTAIYDGKEGGGDGDNDATIAVVNKVTIISDTTSIAVVSDDLNRVEEAVTTLPSVMVAKARLSVGTDGESFDVVLQGDFSMTGLKTPKVDMRVKDGEDPDGPILEKLFLLDKLVTSIFTAFKDFAKRNEA